MQTIANKQGEGKERGRDERSEGEGARRGERRTKPLFKLEKLLVDRYGLFPAKNMSEALDFSQVCMHVHVVHTCRCISCSPNPSRQATSED